MDIDPLSDANEATINTAPANSISITGSINSKSKTTAPLIKTLVQVSKPPADVQLHRLHKISNPLKPNYAIDEESIRGHFGWLSLQAGYLPYIFRGNKKYCSTKMFEGIFLVKYLSLVKLEIYKNCTDVHAYSTTPVEEKLLNEINFVHCNNQFATTVWYTIIEVDEAIKFLDFLTTCYSTLYLIETPMNYNCGFLMIDNSIVAYVIVDSKKYIPLLYFDGIGDCKLNTTKLIGWDLSYLKLCFKIQKLREDYVKMKECVVGNLEDIKELFPPNTVIKDVRIKNVRHCVHMLNKKVYLDWFTVTKV